MTILDYKINNNTSTDRERGTVTNWATVTRGSRNPKHGKRKHYIVHKPSRLNNINSKATPRVQHVEATSGGSHAARGSTGTLAFHGAGEERRGRRRHPTRGRSGLHTVCGGGQTAQDVVRVSSMDGERDLSTP
jgi:hypothetical protein